MLDSERAAASPSPVTYRTPALGRLRAETRALHEQLEAVVPILQPGADESTYRWYLQKLLGFHRPLEPALFATPGLESLGLRRQEREKRPWLERDLLALGLSASELRDLPDCPRLPVLHGLPGALGCAYVLEGAMLGAQLIVRELSARLPEVMAAASAYLRCYGAHTGARWHGLVGALEQAARDEAALVAGARETFRCLQLWLEQGGAAPRALAGAGAPRGRVAHG